jgi:transcriptional regulator with XRE-family HTH domain
VDPVRVGHAVRALRLRRRWRQVDLADRLGISRSTISRLEAGRLDRLPVRVLDDVVRALDATLELRVRWNGEALDRLLDQAHAGLVEGFVARLHVSGWITEVEVSYSIRGERGSIDVLAFHAASQVVLVAEVKSVVPDSQATLAGIDRKARLAPEIARERGWSCRGVSRLLVIGDSSTARRRVEALATTYRTTFPMSGRDVHSWLRRPGASISGLLFLPFAQPTHGRTSTTGMQRVRRARASPSGSHSGMK